MPDDSGIFEHDLLPYNSFSQFLVSKSPPVCATDGLTEQGLETQMLKGGRAKIKDGRVLASEPRLIFTRGTVLSSTV